MRLDDDEINSYNQRKFLENPQPANIDGLTIFFAVLGAILLSWFIREQYVEWQVKQAFEEFNRQMIVMDAQSKIQFREMQIRAEKAKAENEERIKKEADKIELIRFQNVELEHQKQVAIETQLVGRAAKEAAWKDAYRPTAGCEAENPNRDALKCGNDYAKSHKRFEDNWAENH